MSKILGFILILFSGVILIVIASLFTGIQIDDISYKNINIKKLYLKYDKKITISIPSITIFDDKSQSLATMSSNFTLSYHNQNIEIDVKKFLLEGTDLRVEGTVLLDLDTIDLEKRSQIVVQNLILQFDTKAKKVFAKQAFVEFKNDTIAATFEKPLYGKLDVKDSRVNYQIQSNTLELFLQSTELFNDTIKDILHQYEIDIPIKQLSGDNQVTTNIFIPFSKGDFFIETDVQMKNAVIESYNQKFDLDTLTLHYDNKRNFLQGDLFLKNYLYEDANLSNAFVDYTISFEEKLIANIQTKSAALEYMDKKYSIHDLRAHFKDFQMQLDATLYDQKKELTLDLFNTTDFYSKTFEGSAYVDYENNIQDISFYSDPFKYQGDFKDTFYLELEGSNVFFQKPYEIDIKNIESRLDKDILYTKFIINNPKRSIKMKVANSTNISLKSSNGIVKIDTFKHKNLVDISQKIIPYAFSYDENLSVDIPKYGVEYNKSSATQEYTLSLKKPKKILEALPFVHSDLASKGMIIVQSKEQNNTTITLDNLNLDINGSYFQSDENQTQQFRLPLFPKLNIMYSNSHIRYNKYFIPFDMINIDTDSNKLHATLYKEKTKIDLKTVGNSLEAHASYLSDVYLNQFFSKLIFDDGYIDLNLYAEDLNFIMGDIKLYDTTIQNVTLINSLTTFVNTTPAIINPLLALPTLYRMGENGFNTTGYYLKNGQGSFQYTLPSQQLDIFDLVTNGKMSNFTVNSHIDFPKNTIQADVDISFLKDFTTALNYVPIVGYIFLGDDGEVHTSVDIVGSLDNPEIKTNTLKDSSNGITGVLKRIITLPLEPFNIKTSPQELIDHKNRVDSILNQ